MDSLAFFVNGKLGQQLPQSDDLLLPNIGDDDEPIWLPRINAVRRGKHSCHCGLSGALDTLAMHCR